MAQQAHRIYSFYIRLMSGGNEKNLQRYSQRTSIAFAGLTSFKKSGGGGIRTRVRSMLTPIVYACIAGIYLSPSLGPGACGDESNLRVISPAIQEVRVTNYPV